MEFIAVAYPGQSESVRAALGRTMWVRCEGEEYPRTVSRTWRDGPPPEATHTPEEFLRDFPPAPGKVLEHEARQRGLLK
jgi:hypothetical protein